MAKITYQLIERINNETIKLSNGDSFKVKRPSLIDEAIELRSKRVDVTIEGGKIVRIGLSE